jgi:hypothetical protein
LQEFTISEFLCSACNTENPAISNALPVTHRENFATVSEIERQVCFFVLTHNAERFLL